MGNLLFALILCIVAMHELIVAVKNVKGNGMYL